MYVYIFPLNVQQLPLNCLRLILKPFQRCEESFMISLVCHRWHSVIELNSESNLNKQISYFAENRSWNLLDWYRYFLSLVTLLKSRSQGMLNHKNLCVVFVKKDLLPALQWAIVNRLPWSIECLEIALHNHYDDISNWIKKNIWTFLNEEQTIELSLVLDREDYYDESFICKKPRVVAQAYQNMATEYEEELAESVFEQKDEKYEECLNQYYLAEIKAEPAYQIEENETHINYIDMVSIFKRDTLRYKQIPLDCLRIILEPFQRSEESFIVSLVCRLWHSVIQKNPVVNLREEIFYFAATHNIHVLDWYRYNKRLYL